MGNQHTEKGTACLYLYDWNPCSDSEWLLSHSHYLPTFRKIQSVFGLSDGSGLAVTVARYETPAHTDIDKVSNLFLASKKTKSLRKTIPYVWFSCLLAFELSWMIFLVGWCDPRPTTASVIPYRWRWLLQLPWGFDGSLQSECRAAVCEIMTRPFAQHFGLDGLYRQALWFPYLCMAVLAVYHLFISLTLALIPISLFV